MVSSNELKINLVSLEGPNNAVYKQISYNLDNLPEDFVIVKVDYSALGPYDTGILSYHVACGHPKDLPTTFGFEGVGEIYAVGKNVDKAHIGKNVSFMCDMFDDRQIKAYSEYAVIPFSFTMILKNKENYKNNAYLYGNPFTARGFLEEILLKDKYSSIVIDTATSALAKMILKLCKRHGIKVITITRSETSVKKVSSINPDNINLNSSDPKFIEQLKLACDERQPSLYVTFQGGNLPSRVFEVLPNKAKLMSLGNIQREDMYGFATFPIIFHEKTIEGYTVFPYFGELKKNNLLDKIAYEMMSDEAYFTELSEDGVEYSLKDFNEGIADYKKNSSKGKILFKP